MLLELSQSCQSGGATHSAVHGINETLNNAKYCSVLPTFATMSPFNSFNANSQPIRSHIRPYFVNTLQFLNHMLTPLIHSNLISCQLFQPSINSGHNKVMTRDNTLLELLAA